MLISRRTVLATGILGASVALGSPSRAAEIAPDGTLVFAGDALATYGFESIPDLQASGAGKISWSSTGTLLLSPLDADDAHSFLTALPDALQGAHALVLRPDLAAGLAIRDERVFSTHTAGRLSVTMWGRAHGAEPALEVVYAHGSANVGPGAFRVVAIRTGRETSDGWAEYTTGPIDGSVWTAPLRAILLTARYATDNGASLLIGSDLSPASATPARILDKGAYALVDAVEVRPEPGAATGIVSCTQETIDTACPPGAECQFGHCIDGSVPWGPVPPALDHRTDLVARWAFVAEHLHADRRAAARAASMLGGAAAALSGVTGARGYYGKLVELNAALRDSHASVGAPPSQGTVAYPLADSFSGPLDACFGVARNDLAGGEQVYAIFAVGTNPSIHETLQQGDVLTTVDGIPAATWIATVLPRLVAHQPNDPGADPSATALVLSKLLGRYAHTIGLSRCQPHGGCAPLPEIPVADEVWSKVVAGQSYSGSSVVCSPRFLPAVSHPPADNASPDEVVAETVDGITSIQFDGFSGAYSPTNGWHAWKDPWSLCCTGSGRLLVDARLGHGGKFSLGRWLFALLRGTSQPYGAFAMPRGAYDDPDPAWLFDPSWDDCVDNDAIDACAWTGGQTIFTKDASPDGEAVKIAWVDGNDVSMNDIVPRLLSGRTGFRVFAPHPSHGAYGEVSYLPPIEPSWGRGSVQVLDMRFGPTLAAARAATWESGKGVAPDTVVVQKVSDILAGKDTVLEVAKAWVSQ